MRLSEAILLGDTLKGANPWCFSVDENNCGCALAGARLAAGLEWSVYEVPECDPVFLSKWPWMTGQISNVISDMYFDLCFGRVGKTNSIEQIADYVRSVEPNEPDSIELQTSDAERCIAMEVK